MKRIHSRQEYSVAELVAAAYTGAAQLTRDRLLAAVLVSRILEDWLMHSSRPDLVKVLATTPS
jgi:hypothetical protein